MRSLERAFDRAFSVATNPLRQLGALGFYLVWIVIVSGCYAYAFFDTSLAGAYRSVAQLTRAQWYLGGLMRRLHRYASDGLVVVILAHLAREFAYGRFTGFRWYSWLTGVPLIWLALASGIVGYWMVWDTFAQFIGVATTELFAALPGFDAGMVRNFLVEDTLSDRLFSLLVFLHIGVPLLLLLGLWIHIQRLPRPVTRPDRRLGGGTLGMLPPAFIEFALRSGAAGVLVAACGEGECEFRFGSAWLAERIGGAREPHLRRNVAPDRVRVVQCRDAAALAGALAAFRAALRGAGPAAARDVPAREAVQHE